MKDKIIKFLQAFINHDKLRVGTVLLSVTLILASTVPVSFYSLYNELQLTSQREYQHMYNRALKVEDEVRRLGPEITEFDPYFFKALNFPGENIKVDIGQKGVKDYNHITHLTYKEKLSVFQSQVLSFAVPTFFEDFKEYVSTVNKLPKMKNDRFRFYIDEENKAYGVIIHSFEHGDHFDTVTITRDLTPQLKLQFANSMRSFLFMFFWFFIMSVIGSLVCLKYIFKPLQEAIDSSFDDVVENNYQTRIRDPKYGEEISKIIRRFNRVLDRMQELVTSNLNSMQDVSHEVKTYLTAIKQSVDVIKMYGKDDKEIVEAKLAAIEDNITRVTSIMTTILELARLKQISKTDNANYYDAKYLINYLLNFKRKVYPDFVFETDYDDEKVEVFIDRNHFYLMMNPIVDNAVKYSIDSNKVRISVLANKPEGKVYVSITNWGIVIDEKEIPFLFDRYFRGKNFENKKQGSGLGLTIAREVMGLYKGNIEVSSQSNGETTFTLCFQLSERKEEDSGEKS